MTSPLMFENVCIHSLISDMLLKRTLKEQAVNFR
jgi:hypothetical protein